MKSIVKRCSVAVVLALAALLPDFTRLHTSLAGLELIANLEGCRLSPYQCSAGVWTSGIGHTAGVKPGGVITEREAAVNLVADVMQVEKRLAQCMPVTMPQPVYDAVVSFAFNVGTGAACASTLAHFINKSSTRRVQSASPLGICQRCQVCRAGESPGARAGAMYGGGIMSRGNKLFLALVLLAVIALLKWQVITLGDSLDAATLENVRVAAALTESRAAIAVLQDSALRNEREQVMLRQRIAASDQLATRRNHTITRLLNENEALRRWYQSALPDDVIRLHSRPDFATPDDYLRWLSESQQLPAARQQPEDQR